MLRLFFQKFDAFKLFVYILISLLIIHFCITSRLSLLAFEASCETSSVHSSKTTRLLWICGRNIPSVEGFGDISLPHVFDRFLFYKREESWFYELLGNLIVMVFVKVYLKVRKYVFREIVWDQLDHFLSWDYRVVYAIVITVGDWFWYGNLTQNASLLKAVLWNCRIIGRALISWMLPLKFLFVLLQILLIEVNTERVQYLFSHVGYIFPRLQNMLLKQFV